MKSTRTKSARATFSIPADTLRRFDQAVPARQRSRRIAEMMEAEIQREEAVLIAACEAVNADPEMAVIESELDALPDTMADAWNPR